MEKRIAIVCSVVLALASASQAAIVWVDNTVGNWSVGSNWVGGVAPISTTDEARINIGTVTLDCNVSVGMLRMAYAATTNVATLNINADYTLTVSKATGELISVGYLGAAAINQSAGTVKAYNPSATTGEIRIMRNSTNPQSYYNLSGGVMDTQILRGGFTGNNPGLNDTGGTIVARNCIYRLGAYDGAVTNWTQGDSLLAVGDLDTVGTVSIGLSGYETKHILSGSGTSKLEIDLFSESSFDVGHGSGHADFTLGELKIKAKGTYIPDYLATFDIWKLDLKAAKAGTGTFDKITDNLPHGHFTAAWVETDGMSDGNETLRITYIPEPATVALLLMGGSALVIRRRR